MVRLSQNPIEGGSVVIRLSFKDPAGIDYIPVDGSVFYSLFAMHPNKIDGKIVNGKEDVALTSASIIDIVLQGNDLAIFPECSYRRRLVIKWVYLINGEETQGVDTVDFSVSPLPVVVK